MHGYDFNNGVLKAKRVESGKKPEQVALDLDITKETYMKFERATRVPPLDRVLQLCAYFGLDPNELLVAKETPAQVAARRTRRTRREQGLPDHVEDESALDAGAALLRS